MQKAKKICCRITPRRVMSAVVLAASTVNLIIVGAAFEVSSRATIAVLTIVQTIPAVTTTFFVPTATAAEPTAVTLIPSAEPTLTATSTLTETPTPTVTTTNLPSPTHCVPRYDWPVYFVRRGDTLSALAQATSSSPEELRLANCLPDFRIYVDQPLHVPRLPIASPTSTQTNTPTVFRDPSACVVWGSNDIVFSITPYDPEGIRLLTASYKIQSGQTQNETNLEADGDTYYGSGPASDQYSMGSISYSFSATDNLGSVTGSIEYSTSLQL